MQYNRCGDSGLLLPAVSLGLWHNFGSNGGFDNMEAMCRTAFDKGRDFGISEKQIGVRLAELLLRVKPAGIFLDRLILRPVI